MLSPDPGGSIPQRKLGSILVSEGMVTEEQLEEALEAQKTDTRYVGRILVALATWTMRTSPVTPPYVSTSSTWASAVPG